MLTNRTLYLLEYPFLSIPFEEHILEYTLKSISFSFFIEYTTMSAHLRV